MQEGGHTGEKVRAMATEKEMYEVIGRALVDPDFRASLKESPKAAVEAAGYELTSEQLAALRDADLSAAAESLGDRISKAMRPF
jgi:hypothetical protein